MVVRGGAIIGVMGETLISLVVINFGKFKCGWERKSNSCGDGGGRCFLMGKGLFGAGNWQGVEMVSKKIIDGLAIL